MSIASNIESIKSQLPEGVRLVAVSKFHPEEAIVEAYEAGQRIFGENRAQELSAKVPSLPSDIEWHFIGHLQSNKVRQVVSHAQVIESVDTLRLLRLIDNEASRAGRAIDVLLQLHVAQEEAKSGFAPEELIELANSGELNGLTHTRVRGLMAMATLTADERQIAREFARVKSTYDSLKAGVMSGNESFDQLSMGMTDDWRIAVQHGSTLVRIGTAIFGPRQY